MCFHRHKIVKTNKRKWQLLCKEDDVRICYSNEMNRSDTIPFGKVTVKVKAFTR
jgi:hypothetical protein